ncbi:glycosyltransferase family 4 protein [Patescibacteria group bacterium]|nr:glycosyltransferase family 4 protein [Patescibacteria group bacterium]
MRLLVLTQKVNKSALILGFFHGWLEAMSREFESIDVVALGVGEYDLPQNVRVYSLGKERGAGRLSKLINFYRLVFGLKNKYDAVFVHMNPEYLVLAGWLWKLWKKPVYLWYVHKFSNPILTYASFWVDKIFTANATSCQLKNNKKVVIVGHGINTELFFPAEKRQEGRFSILSVGRMSPIKRYEITLQALDLLISKYGFLDFRYTIVAPIVTKEGESYRKRILDMINANPKLKERTELISGVAHGGLCGYYNNAHLLVHTGEGGADKAVLEAMSCALPVLASSEAFLFLPDEYKAKKDDVNELAEKILWLKNNWKLDYTLRGAVEKDYSLTAFFKKIRINL